MVVVGVDRMRLCLTLHFHQTRSTCRMFKMLCGCLCSCSLQWMTNVEGEMRRTLYQITKEGVFYYAKTAR
jgi:hypothetical protein